MRRPPALRPWLALLCLSLARCACSDGPHVPDAGLLPVDAGAVDAGTADSGVPDAAVPDAGVIHVAAHARFSPGDPLNSGLKLADGWLTAREISGLRLAGPTVILSGCDTGRSEVGSADEIWGLVRAFLVAGASTLIISLWPANDLITAETMASFHADWYAGLGGGHSGPVASLRRAQAALVQRGLHPAAWANLVVIGKP